jgi:hypothetical protein
VRKTLFILALALCAPALLTASQRIIVIEDFTATWCTYCPGAARGIEELDFGAFDTVVPLAYHPSSSDPYYNAVSVTRMNYYAVGGYPTVRLDGNYEVVGGVHTGTMYPTYRQFFDARKLVASPLEIDLAGTYDSLTRQGHLDILLRNTTASAVTGQLHVAVIQSHIYYPWQGMDSLQYLVRDMLPNGSGVSVTVPASDSLAATRDYTLNAAWVAKDCDIVVFVQNTSTKQMYQGARTAVMPKPAVEYYGYEAVRPVPGEDANLTVGLRNMGTAVASGLTGALSTADPYVTVTQPGAAFPATDIGGVGYSTTPFGIHVDAGCPDPHVATFSLEVSCGDDILDTVSLPVNITAGSGVSDGMDVVGNWWHSGIRDAWHLSTYRSHTPFSSWYCGSDASHQYGVETDMRLVSPYFTVGDSAQLSFYHWYITEAAYDFAFVELNNGSPFWYPIASYDGSSGTWQQQTFGIGRYAGQTLRVGFRFISDNSQNYEGWYIDDLLVTPYVTGVAEAPSAQPLEFAATQTVAGRAVNIAYSLPAGATADVMVYDAGGRLARSLGSGLTGAGRVAWRLDDAAGRRVPAGTYFACLRTGAGVRALKVVVSR